MKLKHKALIDKMTLEEKVALGSGATFWKTKAFAQYGIPALFSSDSPHGLRKQEGDGDHLGLGASIGTTCFPTAGAAASTWDVELLRQIQCPMHFPARPPSGGCSR